MIKGVIGRIRRLLLPPDQESLNDETRGAERNRRAALTGGVATIARAVQVGSSLITVPLTLKYLGNERFGLWMTISSVLAMAAFADFGIGNGVLNTVAKAFGRDDKEAIRKAVSSGFAVLNTIAVLLMASLGYGNDSRQNGPYRVWPELLRYGQMRDPPVSLSLSIMMKAVLFRVFGQFYQTVR
jgi:O-antigen/teichoic acid export membrane protein